MVQVWWMGWKKVAIRCLCLGHKYFSISGIWVLSLENTIAFYAVLTTGNAVFLLS